jgi:hypothetical protein
LDYNKAYDRVSWDFVIEILKSRGFSPKWIGWVESVMKGGSMCIRINDRNTKYFKPGKGLHQGHPLSSLLLNLVEDVFAKMLNKAAHFGTHTK